MGTAGVYSAIIHDDNLVGIHDRTDTLGNDNFGGIRNFLAECLADQRISLGIYRTGTVIQNKNFRLTQDGPGNAEALLLPAGNIGAALFDIGIVSIGESTDKIIGLGQFTGVYQLLIGGLRVAPAQVFLYCAAE